MGMLSVLHYTTHWDNYKAVLKYIMFVPVAIIIIIIIIIAIIIVLGVVVIAVTVIVH